MSDAKKITPEIVDHLLALSILCNTFSRIKRTCYHEDGTTQESDSDHTVMLGVLGLSFAREYLPHLDQGKIAQFIFVHDLVEAYAGDVPTYNTLTKEEKEQKDTNEQAALARIQKEFGESFPFVHETIEAYERLDTPEARFVKVFDKLMPPLTYYSNGGKQAELHKEQRETIEEHNINRYRNLSEKFPDQKEVLEALAFLGERINRELA